MKETFLLRGTNPGQITVSVKPSLAQAGFVVAFSTEIGCEVTGIEVRPRAGGGVSYVARIRRGGVKASAVFDTVEEASAWRAMALAAVRTGTDLPKAPKPVLALPVASLTVEDACRELVRGMRSGVIRDRRREEYAPATIVTYEHRLRLHVIPYIGGVPVVTLVRGDVRRLVDTLTVAVSPQIAAAARDALRVVLKRQIDLDVVAVNVAAGVDAPAVPKYRHRVLTPAEAETLQTAADGDRDPQSGALVVLALVTGMRRGELEGVPWGPDGLDLTAGRVIVAVSRNPAGVLGPTKNGGTRTVLLGPDTVARLRRWLLASGRPPAGATVFPAAKASGWIRVRKAAKLADPQPRFHDLRHTAATFYLAAGLRSHVVAELLGHSDAGLVDRLYGHVLPDEINRAGAALDQWIATETATRKAKEAESAC